MSNLNLDGNQLPTRSPEPSSRPTTIPTPRRNGMFPGWGVRF